MRDLRHNILMLCCRGAVLFLLFVFVDDEVPLASGSRPRDRRIFAAKLTSLINGCFTTVPVSRNLEAGFCRFAEFILTVERRCKAGDSKRLLLGQGIRVDRLEGPSIRKLDCTGRRLRTTTHGSAASPITQGGFV